MSGKLENAKIVKLLKTFRGEKRIDLVEVEVDGQLYYGLVVDGQLIPEFDTEKRMAVNRFRYLVKKYGLKL